MRLAAQPLDQALHETRLADTRLARNQHDGALTGLGLLPASPQQRQLLLAADQRRQVRPVPRREAALDGALAHHPRGDDRRGQALDLDRAEILIVEVTPGEPPRARPDHHRARLGQRLQPRREVRRLANDPAFLRFARADEIAHDDEARGDADPHLQWRRRDGVEPGHLLDQLQPRAHGAFGIVLAGPRIAEIGEHPVAHVLGDKPAAAADHLGNAAVIGADHRPQILRVEPRRQCRRADQVAEHHRQMPAFGVDPLPNPPPRAAEG